MRIADPALQCVKFLVKCIIVTGQQPQSNSAVLLQKPWWLIDSLYLSVNKEIAFKISKLFLGKICNLTCQFWIKKREKFNTCFQYLSVFPLPLINPGKKWTSSVENVLPFSFIKFNASFSIFKFKYYKNKNYSIFLITSLERAYSSAPEL